MQKRILILDLDTPVYSAAAAIERRSVLVTHIPTEKQKEFKTRTEFKERLKEKGISDRLHEYSFEDIQRPEPLENGCHILKSMINRIEASVQAEETQFFISGKNNFRDYLELPTRYKSGRSEMIRPVLLKDIKSFAINKYKAELCDGEEPDDRIIHRSYELKSKGHIPIIASIDKDSLAYSGLLLFNQDKPERGILEIPQLGSLWLDSKNKVKGNGFLWYCHQMLIGDATDSYKPTELCGVSFGEKSSFKLLKDCKTEAEAMSCVLKQYEKWYNSPVTYIAWDGKEYTKSWFDIAQLYHKAVRMKETKNDPLDLAEFITRLK